jgi:hypothetical protein
MQELFDSVKKGAQAIRGAASNLDQDGFFAPEVQQSLAAKERKLASAIVASFAAASSTADSAAHSSVNYLDQGGTHLLLASSDIVFTLPLNMTFYEIISSTNTVVELLARASVGFTKLQQERREALWRQTINDPRGDHEVVDATALFTPVEIMKLLFAAVASNVAKIAELELRATGSELTTAEIEKLQQESLRCQEIKNELASYERFLLGYCDKCGFKKEDAETTLDFIAGLQSVAGDKKDAAIALYESLHKAKIPALVSSREIGSLADKHSMLTEDQRSHVASLLIHAYIRQAEMNSTQGGTINLDIRPENVLLRDRSVSGLSDALRYMTRIIGGGYSFAAGTPSKSFAPFRMQKGLAPSESIEEVNSTNINFSLLYTTVLVPIFGFTFDYRKKRPDFFSIPFDFSNEVYVHKLEILKGLPGVNVVEDKFNGKIRFAINEKLFWSAPILHNLASLLSAYNDKISLNKAAVLSRVQQKIIDGESTAVAPISNEDLLLQQLCLAMGFVEKKLLTRELQADGSVEIRFWSHYNSTQDPHLEFFTAFATEYSEETDIIPGAKLSRNSYLQYVITLAPNFAEQNTSHIIQVLQEANLRIEMEMASRRSADGRSEQKGGNHDDEKKIDDVIRVPVNKLVRAIENKPASGLKPVSTPTSAPRIPQPTFGGAAAGSTKKPGQGLFGKSKQGGGAAAEPGNGFFGRLKQGGGASKGNNFGRK